MKIKFCHAIIKCMFASFSIKVVLRTLFRSWRFLNSIYITSATPFKRLNVFLANRYFAVVLICIFHIILGMGWTCFLFSFNFWCTCFYHQNWAKFQFWSGNFGCGIFMKLFANCVSYQKDLKSSNLIFISTALKTRKS